MPKLSRSNPKAAPIQAPDNMPSRSKKSSPKKKKHATTCHSQLAKDKKIAETPNARGKQIVSSPATRRSTRGKNPLALEESNVKLPSAAHKPWATRLTHQSLSAIEEESLNTNPAATKEVSSVPSLMKSPPESRASADQILSANEEETINTVADATKEVSPVPSLRKSAPKLRAPGDDLMGSSDNQGVCTNAIKSPGFTAAASTLIYRLQYGKDETVNELKYEYKSSRDDCDANDMFGRDDSGGSDVSECKESVTSKYVPHGLEYLDNDDILIDIVQMKKS
jgi:hypothetical protein